MMRSHFILYVNDQERSTRFFRELLGYPPTLDVPGMTEFVLNSGSVLGLMPAGGIVQLLGNAIRDPRAAEGTPRAELYLVAPDAHLLQARALAAGGRELSPVSARDWGHRVGYVADPDGHVLGFAEITENTDGGSAHGPVYRVHTRRTVLRCWNPEDAPLLVTAIRANIEHLQPWMAWASSEPEDLQKKVERLRKNRGRFDLGEDFVYAVFDREEGRVLGGTGLHTRQGFEAREIGYWIDKDHLNQGLATEIASALTKVAFEVDRVERVEIRCDPENVRSFAVPRKLGFRHEATLLRRSREADGKIRDLMLWTMFADDYPASIPARAEIEAFDAIGRRIL
jgi:RimJ/RimL family protein N-acetyltransferase/catechol 2,3-dioxygenase-like lactoylglutathione lyase family enzyme